MLKRGFHGSILDKWHCQSNNIACIYKKAEEKKKRKIERCLILAMMTRFLAFSQHIYYHSLLNSHHVQYLTCCAKSDKKSTPALVGLCLISDRPLVRDTMVHTHVLWLVYKGIGGGAGPDPNKLLLLEWSRISGPGFQLDKFVLQRYRASHGLKLAFLELDQVQVHPLDFWFYRDD